MAISAESNSQVTSNVSGSGPFTHTHTCNGSQRLLAVVFSGIRSAATGWSVTGITYNGVAMDFRAAAEELGNSRGMRTEVWTMLAPPTGSAYTISVTPSVGLLARSIAAICLNGVHQTSPVGNTGADNGNKSAYSTNITTTAADSWLVGGGGIRNGTLSWSPGSITELFDHVTGSNTTDDIAAFGAYRVCTTTGSYAFDSTASGSNRGTLAAVEIKPAAAVAAVLFGAELVLPSQGVRIF